MPADPGQRGGDQLLAEEGREEQGGLGGAQAAAAATAAAFEPSARARARADQGGDEDDPRQDGSGVIHVGASVNLIFLPAVAADGIVFSGVFQRIRKGESRWRREAMKRTTRYDVKSTRRFMQNNTLFISQI